MVTLLLGVLTLSKGLNALIEGDIAVPNSSNQGDVKNSFLLNPSQLWANGLVPFVFETLDLGGGMEEQIFSDSHKQLIREAMAHIEAQVPCIRFRLEYCRIQLFCWSVLNENKVTLRTPTIFLLNIHNPTNIHKTKEECFVFVLI